MQFNHNITKVITFKNISWVIMAIVIIWLVQWKGCDKKVLPANVVPEKQLIHDTIQLADESNKVIAAYEDELNKKDKDINKLSKELYITQDGRLEAQQAVDSLLSLRNADDLANSTQDKFNQYKKQVAKADSLCNSKNKLYVSQLNTKDKIINEKTKLYNGIKKVLDTCIQNQKTLTAQNKSLKPRNKLGIGAIAGYDYNNQSFGYGLTILYSMKNGYSVQLSGMQIRNSQQISVGLIKTISFKR